MSAFAKNYNPCARRPRPKPKNRFQDSAAQGLQTSSFPTQSVKKGREKYDLYHWGSIRRWLHCFFPRPHDPGRVFPQRKAHERLWPSALTFCIKTTKCTLLCGVWMSRIPLPTCVLTRLSSQPMLMWTGCISAIFSSPFSPLFWTADQTRSCLHPRDPYFSSEKQEADHLLLFYSGKGRGDQYSKGPG